MSDQSTPSSRTVHSLPKENVLTFSVSRNQVNAQATLYRSFTRSTAALSHRWHVEHSLWLQLFFPDGATFASPTARAACAYRQHSHCTCHRHQCHRLISR